MVCRCLFSGFYGCFWMVFRDVLKDQVLYRFIKEYIVNGFSVVLCFSLVLKDFLCFFFLLFLLWVLSLPLGYLVFLFTSGGLTKEPFLHGYG